MLYCKYALCSLLSSILQLMTYSGRTASTSCVCISGPSALCVLHGQGEGANREHRMKWQAVRFHKWDVEAICWHSQSEQKLNIYTVRECSAIGAVLTPVRETAGNMRGSVACHCTGWETGTRCCCCHHVCRVWSEEKFREEGAQIVNSVVYGGISAFVCLYNVTNTLAL